jgi:hypothetical protein
MRAHVADAGDVIVGWLWKVVLFVGVIGVIGFEALSIGMTHIQLNQAGDDAGTAALQAYTSTHDPRAAYAAAEASAEHSGAQINSKSFRVNVDGSIQFTIHKTANTLVLGRFDRTRPMTVVKETVTFESNSFTQQ